MCFFLSLSLCALFVSLSLFGSSLARFNIASMWRARRYLCDFSKGEANLNWRSRAILPSFTFPEPRLPSLYLPLFSFVFSMAILLRCGWFFVQLTYLYLSHRIALFVFLSLENAIRLTLRSSVICGRDSRSTRVLERKKRWTRGTEIELCTCR